MSDPLQRVVDFMRKLCTKKSSEQDIKNIIAGHVHATLTVISDVLQGYYNEDKDKKKIKANMKKSFENLENHDKLEKQNYKIYYSRVLKSQLLFFCYDSSFLDAENEFFPFINGIKLNSDLFKDSIKSVYLCALANFLNSIGSSKFIVCDSDEKTIKESIKKLGIDTENEEIRKSFQRLLTRNGFIHPYESATSNAIRRHFGIKDQKDRFVFDSFRKIFSLRTGEKDTKFESVVTQLLNATYETPLLFMSRFSKSKKKGVDIEFVEEQGPSFISSPPHAFEILAIDQFAYCYEIPADDGENQTEEEEKGEEEENERPSYIQLIASNLRNKQPPIQFPDLKLFKRLGISQAQYTIPSDNAIRGTCTTPFYYELNDQEQKETDDTDDTDDIDNELISKQCQKNLQKSFYTGVYDGLHPIEAQLARILEFSALKGFYNDAEYKSIFGGMFEEVNEDKHQFEINVSRSLISLMLFPNVRVGLAQDTTDLFILSIFAELYKLLKRAKVTDSIKNAAEYFVPGKVRRVFQLAMDGIIPAVYQNILKLANWTQNKKTSSTDFEEPEDEKYHSIYPFSGPIFLKQFILNPSLRQKCPVIYAYLRLHSRFCLAARIGTIAQTLYKIWENYSQKINEKEGEDVTAADEDFDDGTTFEDMGIDDEKLNEFLNCWKGAADFVKYGPMSDKARARLEQTLEPLTSDSEEDGSLPYFSAKDIKVRPFLPYEPSSWPGLIVLESLSQAHNEFISILQQHSKIHSFDVNDKDFNVTKVLDTTVFGQFFSRAIRGCLGPDCLPVFDEEVERVFLEQAALLPYYYIIHPIINFTLKEDISMSSKGLVTLYEERFDTIDLTEEQKKMLQKYIKEEDRTAGALLLLTKFMFAALDDHNSSVKNNFQSTTYLSTFIEKTTIEKTTIEKTPDDDTNDDDTKDGKKKDGKTKDDKPITITMTPIESESYSALLIAKGKLREDFKVGQFSKMYSFLKDPIDHCRKAFSLQEAIINNVITNCKIKENEIDNIKLQNVCDYRPFFTVIPKIFADLFSGAKDEKDYMKYTSYTPSKLVDEWLAIKEENRMLIDSDELATLKVIKDLDEGKNNNKLVTMIAYFNDAKENYKW